MAAYIVVQVEFRESERYADYRQMVPPTLEAYGGRFLIRGGAVGFLLYRAAGGIQESAEKRSLWALNSGHARSLSAITCTGSGQDIPISESSYRSPPADSGV